MFSVQADHADDDADQAQHFAADGTDGEIGDIINQPGGGTDQAVLPDGLGIGKAEADGRKPCKAHHSIVLFL